MLIFDQQRTGRETVLMTGALEQTFAGLVEANRATRAPAPLSALTVGLKCGGSDGFSGISANPTLGYISDLLGELGGKSILSEFPELHGVEQELINRCATDELAQRFFDLMQAYSARAKAVHSGFEMNPSPGNIEDGLLTDAMKSAGAARKGGIAPVRDVLDFPAHATTPGLNLLCTPGNDVECITAQAAAGANIILFTTGLGTPTGNPVAPVIKISTNSATRRPHGATPSTSTPAASSPAKQQFPSAPISSSICALMSPAASATPRPRSSARTTSFPGSAASRSSDH